MPPKTSTPASITSAPGSLAPSLTTVPALGATSEKNSGILAATCVRAGRLTPREAECVELAHLRNADIGLVLGISAATVKKHLSRAFLKLGTETRTAAVLLQRAA